MQYKVDFYATSTRQPVWNGGAARGLICLIVFGPSVIKVAHPWYTTICETGSLTNACDLHQGCQIFFAAYGQNPDKKWPKWLFFEKVMAKITKCFNYGNFYIHTYLKLFGKQYIFRRKNVVFPKKQVSTPKQQFLA